LPRNISPASIVGLPGQYITDVTLRNIEIIYPGNANPTYAFRGISPAELDSIPEMPAAYPEYSQFKELPAWGFYMRHAKNVSLDHVILRAKGKDYRPAIVLDDVQGARFSTMTFAEPTKKKKQVHVYKSTDISLPK
jgi:hypothetical protein